LNSIGLDNDGIDAFVAHHLPYLRELSTATVVSIAARTEDDFAEMAARLQREGGVSALELNISCPNVTGGVDFGTDPARCEGLVRQVRNACDLPILAKLTPNVTSVAAMAQAAASGGADAISAINTLLGMAIDWRKQKPLLGNVALRCVHQIRQAVSIPIVGIGGIGSIDDVMEFFVAGASAIQLGTANYYDPTISMKIIDQLPAALAELQATSVSEVVGSLKLPGK
jgi:dihydroorotate dehydrogenase (NAD+) catalytic subunit